MLFSGRFKASAVKSIGVDKQWQFILPLILQKAEEKETVPVKMAGGQKLEYMNYDWTCWDATVRKASPDDLELYYGYQVNT